MGAMLPQRCPLAFVYGTWLVYVAGAVALGFTGRYAGLVAWLVLVPAALYGYVRIFPRISSALGYGSVEDRPQAPGPAELPAGATVTLYTGAGCPFCPIVERRLRALQKTMPFELVVVDVTARPDVAARQRIGALPTVEIDGRRHAGCATSEELAELIAGEPALTL